MSIYRIKAINSGDGFKVDVNNRSGIVRVVGIFATENDASAWIETDRRRLEPDINDLGWAAAPGA